MALDNVVHRETNVDGRIQRDSATGINGQAVTRTRVAHWEGLSQVGY